MKIKKPDNNEILKAAYCEGQLSGHSIANSESFRKGVEWALFQVSVESDASEICEQKEAAAFRVLQSLNTRLLAWADTVTFILNGLTQDDRDQAIRRRVNQQIVDLARAL